jgi:hypothetical protein
LTEIWLASSQQETIAQATNDVDRLLATAPLAQGEEFYGERILVVPPLAVTYTIRENDLLVQILQVWCKAI